MDERRDQRRDKDKRERRTEKGDGQNKDAVIQRK